MKRTLIDKDKLMKALDDFHGLNLRDGKEDVANGVKNTVSYIEILCSMSLITVEENNE